jgi:hypothetical protein
MDHLLCIPFFPSDYTTIGQLKNNTEIQSEGKRAAQIEQTHCWDETGGTNEYGNKTLPT